MNSLRAEADAAIERAEAAEAKCKLMEQQILSKDQEITSLVHRVGMLDQEVEKLEARVAEEKTKGADSEQFKVTFDNSTRKIELLEEELDKTEQSLKETVEKCVS